MTLTSSQQDSSKVIFLFAILFSSMVHLFLIGGLPLRFYAPTSSSEIRKPKIIHVARIKPDQGQIVDIQDTRHDTKEDVETDYLSDRNRKVEKQTRALEITRQQNQSSNSQTDPNLSEKKSKYSLNLSESALREIAQQSQPLILNSTSNYLPEITIGNETLLNTKEFAFNAYYLRMKRDVEGFWNPGRLVQEIRALQGTYITKLNIVLDKEGDLLQIQILKSSGVPALDHEAAQAIERASPFPNPPKELLGDDEKIRANWAFIFDRTSLM